jgi:anti-anti-sigma factor
VTGRREALTVFRRLRFGEGFAKPQAAAPDGTRHSKPLSRRRRCIMSEIQTGDGLGREDFGAVTVLRVQVPMLRSDEETDALFQQTFALVDGAKRSRLVLNLDRVVYLASAALGKLVILLNKARSAGGRLTLCKVNRTLADMLRMTHLADILLMYGDEQEAVLSFG